MDSIPPPKSTASTTEGQQAAHRRHDLLEMHTTYLTARSWGESLLPIMVMAMEACWLGIVLIVIASTNFFGTQNLLLPLWAPFLLLAGTAWFTMYLQKAQLASVKGRGDVVLEKAGSLWLYVFIVCALLLTIWASIYSSTALLIDPHWLLSMLDDFLQFNTHAEWSIAIILIGLIGCWRGIRCVKHSSEPSDVTRGIFLGLAVFIVAILILAKAGGQSLYSGQLLTFTVLFFSLSLLAHAMAHTAYLRQINPSLQQGNPGTQERGLFLVIGMVCACLVLLVLLIDSFANPAFLSGVQHSLTPLGQLYDKAVTLLVTALAFLATPLFWLFSLLPHKNAITNTTVTSNKTPKGTTSVQSPEYISILSIILQVALPLLGIALFIYLIRRYRHKRRRLIFKNTEYEDVHESLWSWQLFWAQWRAFVGAIWHRILRRTSNEQMAETGRAGHDGTVEPVARSIREIYRAFLAWSASQGTVRKKYETPDEFEQRLDEKFPLAKEDLRAVTEAYTAVRYGDTLPDEAAVARTRQHWDGLRQQTL